MQFAVRNTYIGRSIAKPRDLNPTFANRFQESLCKPDVPKTGYANQEFIGVLLLSGDTITVRIEEEQDEAVVSAISKTGENRLRHLSPSSTSRIHKVESS
jgi:hypothetical protein